MGDNRQYCLGSSGRAHQGHASSSQIPSSSPSTLTSTRICATPPDIEMDDVNTAPSILNANKSPTFVEPSGTHDYKPSKDATRALTKLIQNYLDKLCLTWEEVPTVLQERIYEEWKVRFIVIPSIEQRIDSMESRTLQQNDELTEEIRKLNEDVQQIMSQTVKIPSIDQRMDCMEHQVAPMKQNM